MGLKFWGEKRPRTRGCLEDSFNERRPLEEKAEKASLNNKTKRLPYQF